MPELIKDLYEILYEVGQGGFAKLYLARHVRLDTKVVLKVYKKRYLFGASAKSQELIETLLPREVNSLKKLNHTYLPKIYDFFIHDGMVYTVMDFIDGESLDKPLSRGEVFSPPQVVKISRQLLEALCYLHENNVLHSDINPSNIMLAPNGDIRLIDFCLSQNLGEGDIFPIGRTIGYASPEHYGIDFTKMKNKNGWKSNKTAKVKNTEEIKYKSGSDSIKTEFPFIKNEVNSTTMSLDKTIITDRLRYGSNQYSMNIAIDIRSDIYGLGATLYHLLTGRKPNGSAVNVIPLTEKDAPPSLVYVINKAMEPNPKLRYQTAAEMLDDINRLYALEPLSHQFKPKAIFHSQPIIPAIIATQAGLHIIAGMITILAYKAYKKNKNSA